MRKFVAITALVLMVSGASAANNMSRNAMETVKAALASDNTFENVKINVEKDSCYIYDGPVGGLTVSRADCEEIKDFIDELKEKDRKTQGDSCEIAKYGRATSGGAYVTEMCLGGYTFMETVNKQFVQVYVNGMTGPKLKECSCR